MLFLNIMVCISNREETSAFADGGVQLHKRADFCATFVWLMFSETKKSHHNAVPETIALSPTELIKKYEFLRLRKERRRELPCVCLNVRGYFLPVNNRRGKKGTVPAPDTEPDV